MKKYLFSSSRLDNTSSIGLLILRLGFGAFMAFGHGLPKLRQFTTLKEGFPVPAYLDAILTSETSLLLAIATELLGGCLIALGLLTRPAAIFLLITMLTAAFSILAQSPWFLGPQTSSAKEPALLYAFAFLVIGLCGAGRFSLDRLFGNP